MRKLCVHTGNSATGVHIYVHNSNDSNSMGCILSILFIHLHNVSMVFYAQPKGDWMDPTFSQPTCRHP